MDGPDAAGREFDSAGRDVGGGKSELAPELVAGHDFAAHRVGSAEHAGRGIEVAIADGLADPGAADALALEHDGRHRFQVEAVFFRRIPEERNIAAAVVAEAPILADGDSAHGRGHQALNELGCLHFCEGLVEMERGE